MGKRHSLCDSFSGAWRCARRRDAAARRSLPFKNWRGRDVWGHSALNPTPKQVEGIALRCPRPGGRNEREKDTRFATRFPAPGAALGAGTPQRGDPYLGHWGGEDG